MNKLLSYEKANKALSLKEKTGQLFMPAAFINDTEEEIIKLEKRIREQSIGALCFFHSRASAATNFEGKKKVVHNEHSFETLQRLITRYQNAALYPLLIAIDAEWGLAMRIESTPQYPYAITLGAIKNNTELIYEVGKNIAKDCKSAGIHWNLAPCVDINNNPLNPVIGYRSFGENKTEVTKKALAFIQGTQSEDILTSIKHFPGHGDTATDSHLNLPVIDKSKESLFANELYPFLNLISESIDSIMIGHLSVPELANGSIISSSISESIIKGVLRAELGYDGIVISDALNMHAVSKNHPTKGELEWLAFNAGNDVLCFAKNITEGIETILKKALPEQIEQSFKRIWKLKEKALKNQNQSINSKLKTNTELNRKIAEHSLTLLKGSPDVISNFRATDFCTLTIKRYSKDRPFEEILENIIEMKSEVEKENDILLLLTPPQVKPNHNFGLLQQEIDFINELICTKNVVLYLFGNPYVLNYLDISKATAVIIVYQSFKEFQEVATEHFLGKLKAKGKLPVAIK